MRWRDGAQQHVYPCSCLLLVTPPEEYDAHSISSHATALPSTDCAHIHNPVVDGVLCVLADRTVVFPHC